MNLGGIANISSHRGQGGDHEGGPGADGGGDGPAQGSAAGSAAGDFVAFDVCPANRVLNSLAGLEGRAFDEGGSLAASGRVDVALLERLNALPYYDMGYPKSLGNEFGTDTVYPMVREAIGSEAGGKGEGGLRAADGLRTYVEHIVVQVGKAVQALGGEGRMLVTGGGAYNTFLIGRLREVLAPLGVEVIVPEPALVDYKEALVMALIGVLRWREESNVLASVTGASRDSIGGAVWMGQEG